MDKEDLFNLNYSKEFVSNSRDKVRREFISNSQNVSNGEISALSGGDLALLFSLYDKIFFDDYFKNNFKDKLSFSVSNRMRRNAGKTVMRINSFEIVIAVNFFFDYEMVNRDKVVNGIHTSDALNALQLVFEHEICHLIEFHIFNESSCRKKRFKTLVFNIFGHTNVYHELPSRSEISSKIYEFKPGQKVSFLFRKKRYKGIISSVNKRAAVMVKDFNGRYMDRSGTRYTKWYVPFEDLKHGNDF